MTTVIDGYRSRRLAVDIESSPVSTLARMRNLRAVDICLIITALTIGVDTPPSTLFRRQRRSIGFRGEGRRILLVGFVVFILSETLLKDGFGLGTQF